MSSTTDREPRFGLPAILLLLGILLMFPGTTIVAQVQVDISFRRNLYMVYEPVIATVSITNLTGADLELADTPRNSWFSIQVEAAGGRPIPPVEGSYSNQPMRIGAGQKVRRSINITPIFPISEFGSYKVRAAVYVEALGRYFSSQSVNIEITEGRLLWEETVGVPPNSGSRGKTRTYSLLSHRLPSSTMLYLRVSDEEGGVIYCTTQLGRFLAYGDPAVLLDQKNEIHILHNMAPKEYLYSHFSIDGKVQKQQALQDWGSKPALARTTQGGVAVVGGTPFDPKATPPEMKLPGLGEHPPDLPSGKPTPTKEEQDARPENLLSR